MASTGATATALPKSPIELEQQMDAGILIAQAREVLLGVKVKARERDQIDAAVQMIEAAIFYLR